jgi:hypothetical protein
MPYLVINVLCRGVPRPLHSNVQTAILGMLRRPCEERIPYLNSQGACGADADVQPLPGQKRHPRRRAEGKRADTVSQWVRLGNGGSNNVLRKEGRKTKDDESCVDRVSFVHSLSLLPLLSLLFSLSLTHTHIHTHIYTLSLYLTLFNMLLT